ncbi:MAG TPA: DedA family protein [Gaiellaceae bacterium]
MLVASITGSLTDSITSLIGNHGVEAVFGLMVTDAVFPAFSELVMLYAGALAAGAFAQSVVLFGHPISSRPLAYLTMVLAGTIGYTVGSLGGWAIGIYGGRPFLERHGRWFRLSHEELGRAERWFDRFGSWAVLLGRITPIARSFISIPAGVFRARLASYTILTLIGSTIWCLVLQSAGFALGTRWEKFQHYFHYVDYAVAAVFVIGAVLIILRWWRSSKLAGRDVQDSAD